MTPLTRRYTLTLTQRTPPTPGQPDKQPLVIPVVMGLLDGCAAAEIAARTLLFGEAEQSFVFDDVAERPVPSLLRGFSAPVKLSGDASRRSCSSSPRTTPIRSSAGNRGSSTRRSCCWRWPLRGGAARRRRWIRG